MKTEIISAKFEDVKDKILVLPLYEEDLQEIIKNPKSDFERLVKEVVSDAGFKAEHMQFLFVNTNLKTKRILLAGLGKKNEINLEKIRAVFGNAVKRVKSEKVTGFTAKLPESNLGQEEVFTAAIEGIELGEYAFDKYKTEKNGAVRIERYSIISQGKNLDSALANAKNICNNVKFVRDIVNEPGSALTPLHIAEHAEKIAREFKLKCTILDEKEMEKLGMNLILNVSRASSVPPRLITLEYNGDSSSKEKIMLVGKGITFDSGGLDLKNAIGMETMKMDMAGAGAVLGIMKSIAQLGLKRNVVGVIPTCENLIGPKSYKPGDVIVSYNKTTVEVLNTDAEGRLVLGDAIAYGIEKFKPKYVIDLATLTGAVLIVFGENVAGMVSTDDKLSEKLFEAGQETFERVWRLPLYDEYKEMVKSDIADIKNIGHKSGYAGTITGAAFIQRFAGTTPWAHLDIAGTAWAESERDYVSKGGTGFGVRLIAKMLERI